MQQMDRSKYIDYTKNGPMSVTVGQDATTPNAPYISCYKDGMVYVGNGRCSLRLFKKCPPELMEQMLVQLNKENKKG